MRLVRRFVARLQIDVDGLQSDFSKPRHQPLANPVSRELPRDYLAGHGLCLSCLAIKNANVSPSLSSPMNNWSKGISWTCCSSSRLHQSSCLRVSSSLRVPLLACTLLRLVTSHVPRPTPCLDCLFWSFSIHELLSPRCS